MRGDGTLCCERAGFSAVEVEIEEKVEAVVKETVIDGKLNTDNRTGQNNP